MKKQIIEIIESYGLSPRQSDKCADELLLLFNDIRRSEQLICDCIDPIGYEDKNVSRCLDCNNEIKAN